MSIREEMYQNGTLISAPWQGQELGLFVAMPDEQVPMGITTRIGQSLDIVVRRAGGDWVAAPEAVLNRFMVEVRKVEEEQFKNPVEPPEGGVRAVHRVVLGFLTKAFTRFVEGSLN